MKTLEERLRASCAMCGGNLSNPTIYEGDTYRYVEVRGCCYDVEFYAPPGFKLDQYPYGEPLSEWPEDFQSEVILQLNTRARTDDALAIVADAQKELTLADGSISSAPGTISFGSENLQSYKECEVCGGKRYWVNTLDAFVPCTFCGPTNSPSEGKE